ncbi:hypothetical protein [Paucisalibacillus sp. EB02]|uniref:hypothetical protein n=1 Tax=Paucisalibacillus sp. EB02 TaxID=1347087 RepID=UPI0004B6AEE3|nr:hypothetical protein [Paucisalibacillus sp. EB02]
MNTEINFLEKKSNKYIISLILGLVFLLLSSVVVGVILFQQHRYETAINSTNDRINQYEILMQEQSAKKGNVKQLQQLSEEVGSIKEELIPNVALYKEILGELDNFNQMISYDFNGENQFVIVAIFDDLDSIAHYVRSIMELGYILDGELSNVINTEGAYEATLTFIVDTKIMREELVDND